MESVIFVIILITVIITAVIRTHKIEKLHFKEQNTENMNSIPKYAALIVMKEAFKDMGCQSDVSEDNFIAVTYQGEKFLVESHGYDVRVWDPSWYCINANSPDLGNIKEAVNEANYSFGPTIVLSKPDNEGNILFHSRRDIMVHPSLPEPALYMKSVFDTFFMIKDTLKEEFHKIDTEQEQQINKIRPIGFNTYN